MCTRVGYFDNSKQLSMVMRTMDFESDIGVDYGLFAPDTTIAYLCDYSAEFMNKFKIKNSFMAKYKTYNIKVEKGLFTNFKLVTDGVNNQGLTVSALWNSDCALQISQKMPSGSVSALTIPQVLLGSCNNVNDVINLLKN